jgi:glucose/arabinose dehydrogenase
MTRRTALPAAAALLLLLAAAGPASAETADAADYRLASEVAVEGLVHPWSLAFLPDGAMLVTERPGRLRLIVDGQLVDDPVAGVPEVAARGQGGLLDVAVDPDFAANGLVYLSYAEPAEGRTAGTAVARARLVRDGAGARLEETTVIFRQEPKLSGGNHFGARIAFAPDGALLVTLGERTRAELAQDPTVHLGKVVRIGRDGSVPAGNPFTSRKDARPEIWSLGHRNPQGAAVNPSTGELWVVEHGAKGGDEVNIARAGRNYGWPVITYGTDYDGSPIGRGTAAEGLEQPVHYWDPSIAPSGATFYTGDLMPAWKGDLIVGALKFKMLVRLDVEGDRIVGEERLFKGAFGRIRDVRTGPDGALWILTDEENGALIRIAPEAETGSTE